MEWVENLFFAVVIVFWVLSLLAKMSKKNQASGSGEKKGFTLRVLEFIAALKEASEKEMQAQAPVAHEPVPLAVKTERTVASTTAKQVARQLHEKQSLSSIGKKLVPGVTGQYPKTAVLPQSSVIAPSKKGAGGKFHKQKMRDAIVWSEVLGKPIALRDN